MEYFEIFMDRMILCRKAAKTLNVEFQLVINNQKVLLIFLWSNIRSAVRVVFYIFILKNFKRFFIKDLTFV